MVLRRPPCPSLFCCVYAEQGRDMDTHAGPLSVRAHALCVCAHARTPVHETLVALSHAHPPTYPHTPTHTHRCTNTRALSHTHIHTHTGARDTSGAESVGSGAHGRRRVVCRSAAWPPPLPRHLAPRCHHQRLLPRCLIFECLCTYWGTRAHARSHTHTHTHTHTQCMARTFSVSPVCVFVCWRVHGVCMV